MATIKIGIYYTLGDGGMQKSFDLMQGALEGGAQLLEIGLPFSDPLLDGPVIQQSHTRAMGDGALPWGELCTSLGQLVKLARGYGAQVSLMTSAQLLYTSERRHQLPEVDGLLLTDIDAFANAPFLLPSPRVWFVSQDLALQNLAQVPTEPISMVYLTRVQGITGESQQAGPKTAQAIAQLKQLPLLTKKEIWLGFGISRASDVAEAARFGADGVVVGSAFVNMACRLNPRETSEVTRQAARDFVRDLLS